MATDLNSLGAFLAVAESGNFRVAAERLGITRPAVSQAIRRLEDQLGIALFQRTTRSVRLTEEGGRLFARVSPAMAEIGAAMEQVGDRTARPSGQLRLAVSSIAERFLSGRLLADFVAAYPAIQLDLLVTDDHFDIVAEGYDAGVRLGEVIEQDMIAIPVSGDQRQIAVAAPAYLAARMPPRHPRDLVDHVCIGWRPAPGLAPYRWEFEEDGRAFDVAVDPEVSTNDMNVMVAMARAGAGITFGMEETFRPWLKTGALVPLLEAYSPPFAGFYLYFPNRRNMAPRLRALIDHVRMTI